MRTRGMLVLAVLGAALALALPDPAEAQTRAGSRGVRAGTRPLSGVALSSQGAVRLRHRASPGRAAAAPRFRFDAHRSLQRGSRFYYRSGHRHLHSHGRATGLHFGHRVKPRRRGDVHVHGPDCPEVRRSHLRHGRAYRHYCEACGRVYRSRDNLGKHLRREHGVRRSTTS